MMKLQYLKDKHFEGHLLNLLKQARAGHTGKIWDLKLDLTQWGWPRCRCWDNVRSDRQNKVAEEYGSALE